MSKEFVPALRLTTPHMTGQPVKDAQWLMQGNSVFGPGLATYKDGDLDGDYGPQTAQAAARTKWWLGYPESAVLPTFGQTLYEYLNPQIARPLPPDYKTRRAARIAAITPGVYAIETALTQLGYEESPRGSNRTKYGQWYGFNGVPWCAIFESWCFAHSEHPRSSYRYAAVEMIYLDARAGRNGLRLVSQPQRGDVVCYSLHGDTFAHTAFFDEWIPPTTQFWDVGGNTGPSNVSNGGAVLRQKRDRSMVKAWVRVG